jgi:two-component system, LytTR family, response regulator
MNVIIIEDEVFSAEDLAGIIHEMNENINVLAILHSVKESIGFLKGRTDVDLIFSDIQLGDGLSFEIFKEVKIEAPIIFCTAFNEYALEAFKTNGIDYILKPFENKAVIQAINKYYQLKKYFSPTVFDYDALIRVLASNRKEQGSVLVYYKDKVLPISLDEIALFHIEHETTRLLCFNNKTFIVDQPLDQLEKNCGDQFFRINRQFLVNRKVIKDATHYFPRKYVVNISMDFKETMVVSKNRTSAFLQWLIKK